MQCAHQVSSRTAPFRLSMYMMRRHFRIVDDGNKAMEELGEQAQLRFGEGPQVVRHAVHSPTRRGYYEMWAMKLRS